MSPSKNNCNEEILSSLEKVISQLQQKETDRQKETKSHQFTMYMFALSVIVNGIAISYFKWTVSEIYEHDKRIELLRNQMNTVKEEVSRLNSQYQQILNLLQNPQR